MRRITKFVEKDNFDFNDHKDTVRFCILLRKLRSNKAELKTRAALFWIKNLPINKPKLRDRLICNGVLNVILALQV